ncbi:MAG TPA: class A beta-lactamase [Blastocatellia bacterium]|nr:class A beta-lactamase [Blastocatellia bacterium]
MFRKRIGILFALALCGAFAFAQSPSTDDLRAVIGQISGAARGRVGARVTLLETGESVALRGGERFPMQSVYKLPIGMAVLHQTEQRVLNLDQKISVRKQDLVSEGLGSPIRDRYPRGVELSLRELLRYMVSESDGTASDVLLRLVGGPQFVNSYLRGLGVNDIVVATTENEMAGNQLVQYRNWATPDAMVALLRAVQEGRGLSTSSRALLMQWMTESPTGPRRIKGLLPAGTVVAHKTGSSGTVRGLTRATNDVGIITLPDGRHLAVAVFVSDSRADAAAREGVIAKIAQAAWDFWKGQAR